MEVTKLIKNQYSILTTLVFFNKIVKHLGLHMTHLKTFVQHLHRHISLSENLHPADRHWI